MGTDPRTGLARYVQSDSFGPLKVQQFSRGKLLESQLGARESKPYLEEIGRLPVQSLFACVGLSEPYSIYSIHSHATKRSHLTSISTLQLEPS